MRVAEIKWFDTGGDEAEVKVVSEVNESLECWAFCHPCTLDLGTQLVEPLFSLDAKVRTSSNQESSIVKNGKQPWSYVVVGQLIDAVNGLVAIADIRLEVGQEAVPGDVSTGDWVECVCSRVDALG